VVSKGKVARGNKVVASRDRIVVVNSARVAAVSKVVVSNATSRAVDKTVVASNGKVVKIVVGKTVAVSRAAATSSKSLNRASRVVKQVIK
jgi:hypothetical protein